MRSKILAISVALLLPAIVAAGAYYGTVITPILLIAAICIITVLVATGKISGRLLYLYLFAISLSLVWQTTMMGVDVVGSDIHDEYYFAQKNLHEVWDLTYPNSSNTSIVIGLFAPWISRLLMVDMVWVFKVILPLFLAGVPIVLFATFKKMFGEKRAYFATLFLVIIPVYSMEIAQIAKSMVAELFFALMFYAIISDWKWQYKLLGIGGSLVMQILCHYTIGILGICFLAAMLLFRLVSIPIKWRLLATRKVPVFVLLGCLVLGAGVFWGYHGYAANASAVRSVTEVAVGLDHSISSSNDQAQGGNDQSQREKISDNVDRMSYMVKLGTGFDWDNVSIGGKVFRAIQYITQLIILIGAGWLIFRYRKYNISVEYIGLIIASGVLLIGCILIPSVSSIINMSRFYHICLFFIAPLFVLGCEAISSVRVRV